MPVCMKWKSSCEIYNAWMSHCQCWTVCILRFCRADMWFAVLKMSTNLTTRYNLHSLAYCECCASGLREMCFRQQTTPSTTLNAWCTPLIITLWAEVPMWSCWHLQPRMVSTYIYEWVQNITIHQGWPDLLQHEPQLPT